MKNNKYTRNRKKFLLVNICFTAVVVLLCMLRDGGICTENLLTALGCILLYSPFWIAYFVVCHKFKKEYSRSDNLYGGDLKGALENCTDCTEEYALLDKGIFNYSSGRLSLYSDITCLTPRNFNSYYQIWIYENNEPVSTVGFRNSDEREVFKKTAIKIMPDLPIWDTESVPDRKEADRMIRNEFGNIAADGLGITTMTDGEYAELTEGKRVDDSTGPLADKDKLRF